MLIWEVADPDAQRLAAISQFLIGRAGDVDAEKFAVSTQTFINLAATQGVSLTADRLKTMIQQPPLNNLIQDVTGDANTGQVVFKGPTQMATPTMTVDQARQTVDSMAKRAIR